MNLNHYDADAIHCVRRAASSLVSLEPARDVVDAVIYFSFGIEKLFKSILYRVNPLFILEKPDFKAGVRLLYSDRLISKYKQEAERETTREPKKDGGRDTGDEINRESHVHAFRGAMKCAAHFSQVVQDNIGTLVKLNEYRGIVAHRTFNELPDLEAWRFMEKHLYPLVTGIGNELGIDDKVWFESQLQSHVLSVRSRAHIEADETEKKINALLAEARKFWEKRKDDAAGVQKAYLQTTHDLDQKNRLSTTEGQCPACENAAVLFCEIDYEWEDGHAEPCGVYVQRLKCHYCDLEIKDFSMIDFLELNRVFYQSREDG